MKRNALLLSGNSLITFLKGTSICDKSSGITLVPFDGSEVRKYDIWFDKSKSPEVMKYLHPHTPYTTDPEKRVSVSEFVDFAVHSDKHVFYRIEHPEYGFVGHVSLNNVDTKDMTCWLNYVIGETEQWGKGIGTNAVGLMLSFLKEKKFCKISSFVNHSNLRSRYILFKFGFIESDVIGKTSNYGYIYTLDL